MNVLKHYSERLVRTIEEKYIQLVNKSDQLRESNEWFRQISENIPEVFWMTVPGMSKVIYVSPAYERIWGRPCREVYDDPRAWLASVHPEDRDRVAGDFDTEKYLKGSFEQEYRIVRPDGSVRRILNRAFPVRNAAGEIYRVTGIAMDITERRKAEAAVEERARLSDMAAETGRVLTLGEALPLTLRAFAEALVRYLGAALARIWLLEPGGDVLALRSSAGMYTHLDGEHARIPVGKFKIGRIAQERKPHLTNDVLNDPRISDPAWARREGIVAFAGYPLMVENDLVGVMGMFARHPLSEFELQAMQAIAGSVALCIRRKQDEAVRVSLEDQLRQAQKMEAVGRLAGGVAHDFNNLLTIITGYAQLLTARAAPGQPGGEALQEIMKAADRAAGLTRQLLAFGRRQVLQPQVLDLNGVVRETDKMLRRLIGEDVNLVLALAPALGCVKADPGQIDQVLMNLAVNARDAMPKGGKLTIETAAADLKDGDVRRPATVPAGPCVVLTVSDTGTGMSPEVRSRIFEPFFTTKEKGKGTGLGLATVYGIVTQSGGFIDVETEPGRGTTFRIYLPRVQPAAAPPETSKAAPPAPRGAETVLLVEDEDAVRNLVKGILEMDGYTVLVARQPAEALEISARHAGEIHLMLTDVVMPGMSGKDLARELGPRRPGMKVLYMSGYTDDAIVHHGVLEPGLSFLQKPFTPEALAKKVREVLDGKA